jgi:hypothetical protein
MLIQLVTYGAFEAFEEQSEQSACDPALCGHTDTQARVAELADALDSGSSE